MDLLDEGLSLDREGYEYRPDLVYSVAVRTCKTGHAYADVGAEYSAYIFGHGLGDLEAHRALFFNQGRVDAQKL